MKLLRKDVFIIFLLLILIIMIILFLNKINYQKANKNNEKIVNKVIYSGWLEVEGTNINYPIYNYDEALKRQQTEDEFVYYEDVSFRNKDEINKNYQKYLMIQGHNILNLSSQPAIADPQSTRFEQLMSFYDEKFLNNHQIFNFSNHYNNYTYQIVAVIFAEDNSIMLKDYPNIDELISFVKKRNIYDNEIILNSNDDIIALMTCTRMFMPRKDINLIVVGKKIEEDKLIEKQEFKKRNVEMIGQV